MVRVTGREEVRAYFKALPGALTSVLRGAAREGAEIIAAEAAQRSESSEVAAGIAVRVRKNEPGRVSAKVHLKGLGRRHTNWLIARGLWLEYGTSPHFITVDESQRGGRGLGRINMQLREAGGDGSLVIGGRFVGDTVFHPGARPSPFMRPALDAAQAEAIAAAQGYINSRLAREGLGGADGPEGEE